MEFSDVWSVNFKSAKKVLAETPEEPEQDPLECEDCEGTGVSGTEIRISPKTLSPEDRDVRCSTCGGSGRLKDRSGTYLFNHGKGEDSAPYEAADHPSVPCPACDAELTRAGATPEQIALTQAGITCPSCHSDLGSFDPSSMEDTFDDSEIEWAKDYWNEASMKGDPYTLCPPCHLKISEANAEAAAQDYADSFYEYEMEGQRALAEDTEYWRGRY